MLNNRNKTPDRRDYPEHQDYPLRESEKIVVLADRRRVPDRRTDQIEVEWIEEDLVILK